MTGAGVVGLLEGGLSRVAPRSIDVTLGQGHRPGQDQSRGEDG